jgi:hypothetical protein
MISLYSLFALAMSFQGKQLSSRMMAIAQDLVALQDSGVGLSQSSLLLIENATRGLVRNLLPPIFLPSYWPACCT